MAPEVMQKYNEEGTAVKLDGSKTDVFSFAVLALYVVTGVMPHEGLSNKDIFVKVRVDMIGRGIEGWNRFTVHLFIHRWVILPNVPRCRPATSTPMPTPTASRPVGDDGISLMGVC